MRSTLLYLASGQYRRSYEDLPFERVILVDRVLKRFPNARPEKSKAKLLMGDALPAIKKLKERDGLKIDCLVSVNEGLCEGGGDYPIFNEMLIGYLNPILADELLVITDVRYYSGVHMRKRVEKMDWGFTAEKLSRDHPKFIEPRLFTTYGNPRGENYGDVYLLKRDRKETVLELNPNLEILLVKGSIWEAEDKLGVIGLNLRPPQTYGGQIIYRFFSPLTRVFNINCKSIEDILAYSEERQIKHLGLIPWMNDDYCHVIDVLRTHRPKQLEKITFYHLRKNDYQMLYDLVPIQDQKLT